MILHSCFITHNRLDLTKRVLETYLETVSVPFSYVVVDNASTDGTQAWLRAEGHPHVFLPNNHYPGYACNRGWEQAPREATHLHRGDNDMAFLPGWCEQAAARFSSRRVGQVGLRTRSEEPNGMFNTGGNCVICRDLWNRGLRWDERPWPQYPPGLSEDTYFSPAVKKMGYVWTRVRRPCLESLASGDWNDPYYRRSYGDRKIERPR